ncbi:MAG TPA: Wzz/FepE/Etk N-terminal domain-containing protein [Solirubrobacteraceae bacterium]|jgi:Mrp family chromosome partitioning ATPase
MNDTTDASAIFAPIWRRKWLILIVAVVVAAGSYLYAKRERPTYQATTQVFLGAGAEEQAPSERSKGHTTNQSDQAAVINSIVVEQVRRRLKAEGKAAIARGARVKAKAPEKSEFITITSEAHTARGAALLANLTAKTYIRRRTSASRRAVEQAIAISRRQLRRIEAAAQAQAEAPSKKTGSGATRGSAGGSSAGAAASPSKVLQEASLSSKINQLESSLNAVSVEQLRPASAASAQLLSPKPRKDAIFGFVIGLVLAAIAAYAFSRFDPRLRSIAVIESQTGYPLLAALPKVRRPIVRSDAQPPRPSAHLVEPLRRLESGLRQPASQASDGSHRVTVFVSPDPGDGKSTIVADLALALRDAGEHVVIVEANFRRPIQNRLLGLEGDGRLAALLAGRLEIDEAVQRVMPALPGGVEHLAGDGEGVATAVQAGVGSLFVLGGDRSVANPPALLGQQSAVELLRSLADRFDHVLIDAPSPLEVSDVLPLLGAVDQIVVVARAGNSREVSARRLRELLQRPACAPVAGVVANCVAPKELKRYGFSSVDASIWSVGRLTPR